MIIVIIYRLLWYNSFLDKPGPVQEPIQISGITAEKCKLSWSQPLQDGGSTITNYIVEKRETSRLLWTSVCDT